VDQAILLDADVYKRAECYHIAQITITMALPSHSSSRSSRRILLHLDSIPGEPLVHFGVNNPVAR
jgi:hypothetical protein